MNSNTLRNMHEHTLLADQRFRERKAEEHQHISIENAVDCAVCNPHGLSHRQYCEILSEEPGRVQCGKLDEFGVFVETEANPKAPVIVVADLGTLRCVDHNCELSLCRERH